MQSVHNFRPQNTLQEIYKDKCFKNIPEPGPAYFYPPASCFLFLILLVLCSHHSSALMSMILKEPLPTLSTLKSDLTHSLRILPPSTQHVLQSMRRHGKPRQDFTDLLVLPGGTVCLLCGQNLSKRIHNRDKPILQSIFVNGVSSGIPPG